jgi:hypothetical protein
MANFIQTVKTVAGAVIGAGAAYVAVDVIKNLGGVVSESTGNLKFPSNLSPDYHMEIFFFQYSRQDPMSIGKTVPLGSVRLPIPANMADTQSVNYAEEQIGTALGGASGSIMGGTPGAVASAQNAIGAAAIGGAARGLEAASPGAAALVSAKFGITANPFLTVLFKNPNYRVYNFAWRLFPRNPSESQILASIYSSVKYHMVPAANESFGGALLTYPSLVKVKLYAGGRPLIPFKYGVIDNATFNFAPDGAPSFHRGGQPTSVDFNISIKEVEYFLKKDKQSMFTE